MNNARNTDPDTSHEAADMGDRLGGSLIVLRAMHALGGNATASEIDRWLGQDKEYCHKRLSDCHIKFKWVVMTTERRPGLFFPEYGQRVHLITQSGYQKLRELGAY
jgi:hypothetical protein